MGADMFIALTDSPDNGFPDEAGVERALDLMIATLTPDYFREILADCFSSVYYIGEGGGLELEGDETKSGGSEDEDKDEDEDAESGLDAMEEELKRLHEAFRGEVRTAIRYLDSRETTAFHCFKCSRQYIVTGGMSWDDEPESSPYLRFLADIHFADWCEKTPLEAMAQIAAPPEPLKLSEGHVSLLRALLTGAVDLDKYRSDTAYRLAADKEHGCFGLPDKLWEDK